MKPLSMNCFRFRETYQYSEENKAGTLRLELNNMDKIYHIERGHYFSKDNILNTKTYGTSRVDAISIIEETLTAGL